MYQWQLFYHVSGSYLICEAIFYIWCTRLQTRHGWRHNYNQWKCTLQLWYICKIQTDVQSLIDVQSSNRRPILKYVAVFHFLKSTSNDVTDVYFKWRHTRFWNNDGKGTRPDSRWGVLDDKNAYVFYSYCR
jgi:hypothetical protein